MQLAIGAPEKKELIQKYQIHPQDTGSPEAQVAILT
ncbi:30S ribosomal protein S15, partial [Candidatus Poribacteria bacterium]|nr:30S ribosomal protein S15 [Candidatus Poribacteria bacterium]